MKKILFLVFILVSCHQQKYLFPIHKPESIHPKHFSKAWIYPSVYWRKDSIGNDGIRRLLYATQLAAFDFEGKALWSDIEPLLGKPNYIDEDSIFIDYYYNLTNYVRYGENEEEKFNPNKRYMDDYLYVLGQEILIFVIDKKTGIVKYFYRNVTCG
ncbi:MAG: hypothetical protein AB8B69_27585 [Chitinophagales bacterium]